jgi:hypothetical protein
MTRSSREHEIDHEYEELLERLADARLEGDKDEILRLERDLKQFKRSKKSLRKDDDR